MATFTLTKTDCHQWKITADDISNVGTVSLYTYMDVLLDDELVFDSVTLELAINLEIYDEAVVGNGDGAFYVKISALTYSTPLPPTLAILCIYDFCDAEYCYKALFKYILCKCVDPCDEDCIELYNIEQKRLDLELIYALYTTVERMVFFEKYKYYGLYTVDTSRKTLMSQIGRAIKKLAIVVDRCGMCSDEAVEDITC